RGGSRRSGRYHPFCTVEPTVPARTVRRTDRHPGTGNGRQTEGVPLTGGSTAAPRGEAEVERVRTADFARWTGRFEDERERRQALGDPDWDRGATLPPAVWASIQRFQVGEDGDGGNLVTKADEAGDPDYTPAVRLLGADEENHPRLLARLHNPAGAPPGPAADRGRPADPAGPLERHGLRPPAAPDGPAHGTAGPDGRGSRRPAVLPRPARRHHRPPHQGGGRPHPRRRGTPRPLPLRAPAHLPDRPAPPPAPPAHDPLAPPPAHRRPRRRHRPRPSPPPPGRPPPPLRLRRPRVVGIGRQGCAGSRRRLPR